jgi:hypothetical protein
MHVEVDCGTGSASCICDIEPLGSAWLFLRGEKLDLSGNAWWRPHIRFRPAPNLVMFTERIETRSSDRTRTAYILTEQTFSPVNLVFLMSHRGNVCLRGCIQKFPDWTVTKYMLTTINTRWEATQKVIAAELTRLTHKIATQLHLVAESCTICSSRSRRPDWKLPATNPVGTRGCTLGGGGKAAGPWSWPLTSI